MHLSEHAIEADDGPNSSHFIACRCNLTVPRVKISRPIASWPVITSN